MHQSRRVSRFSETLRGTRGHDSESTLKTRKDYQIRRDGKLSSMITEVDLEIFIVATVMSFVKDITYQSYQSAGQMLRQYDILGNQRKPSTPRLCRVQHYEI